MCTDRHTACYFCDYAHLPRAFCRLSVRIPWIPLPPASTRQGLVPVRTAPSPSRLLLPRTPAVALRRPGASIPLGAAAGAPVAAKQRTSQRTSRRTASPRRISRSPNQCQTHSPSASWNSHIDQHARTASRAIVPKPWAIDVFVRLVALVGSSRALPRAVGTAQLGGGAEETKREDVECIPLETIYTI